MKMSPKKKSKQKHSVIPREGTDCKLKSEKFFNGIPGSASNTCPSLSQPVSLLPSLYLFTFFFIMTLTLKRPLTSVKGKLSKSVNQPKKHLSSSSNFMRTSPSQIQISSNRTQRRLTLSWHTDNCTEEPVFLPLGTSWRTLSLLSRVTS